MTQKEEKKFMSLLDGEDISSQNLPHFLPDKMAKKAFVLVAGLCFAFMGSNNDLADITQLLAQNQEPSLMMTVATLKDKYRITIKGYIL